MLTDKQTGELTGYPSIDKPWLKYYSEEAINAPLPECTIYEYMYDNNKDYPNDIAINYLGRKITYHQLFENIAQRGIYAVHSQQRYGRGLEGTHGMKAGHAE